MDGSTGVDDVDAVALEQLGILSNEGMGDDGMEADMGFADMEADFDGMEIGGEEEQPPAPQAAPADMGGGDGATNGNSEMVADLSSSGESKHDEDLDLDADDLNADDLEPKDLPEHACRYCGIHNPASVALCLGTGKWFCNARLGMPASCIVQHLVRSRKSAVKLHKESPLGDSMLECYNCGNHNVFMLGFVPTKKDGVVVLICRKCMLLNTMKDMFELEKWTSLIEDKAFLPWLLKSPSDKEQLRARQVTTGQINKLEECWKTQPEATWEDLAKAEGEEDGASVQHVLANYTDGYQYQNVFGPLVKLEADEDRSLKESLGKTDVKIIWEDGLSGKRVAHFHFRESYGYASSHLEVVVGDELALRLAAAVSHTGKDWECSGRVVNIDDLGNVELEVDTRHSKSRSRTSVTEGFSVEFVWKSVTYDRMQEALKTFAISDRSVSGYLYHKLLGHDVVDQPLPVRLPENFNAPNLPALNESQTNALRQVLTRPLALIQGPPGTGKTVTSATLVYHLVQQNLAAQRQDNIKRQVLVTAPSNVAVDQLVEKIHMAGLNVVRLTSKTREAAVTHVEYLCLHKMVPEANPKVKQLMQLREEMGSLTNEDQRRFLREQRKTELEILNLADVICCTCATAGDKRLLDRSKRKSSSKRRGGAAKAGPRRRFQQVLIDEATQATEPEALIPVVTGAKQLILVGDHCQLPPVVICKKAKKAGLSHSLFERLVQIGMRPIRLEVQYRMHPVLSDFPSNMFYDGMLQNGVSSLDRELPGQVAVPWPDRKRPKFFYVSTGIEEQGSSGTSFLNRKEASSVEKLVTSMLKGGLTADQIGVITPYQAQRTYLIEHMVHNGSQRRELYEQIEVASVDAFQGREKDVIIVSCVRSNDKQGIGFLKDERRLNVAMTRAKYGMIILGNPRVLAKDSMLWWHLLMDYQNADLLLEGPLNNLKVSPMTLPKPQRKSNRKKSEEGHYQGGSNSGRQEPRYDDYSNVDSRDDPRYDPRYDNADGGAGGGMGGGGGGGGGYDNYGDTGYGGYDEYGDAYGYQDSYSFQDSYGYAAGASAYYDDMQGEGGGRVGGGDLATQPATQASQMGTQQTQSQSQFTQSQDHH